MAVLSLTWRSQGQKLVLGDDFGLGRGKFEGHLSG